MSTKLLSSLLAGSCVFALAGATASGALIHRYSFDGSGAAGNGTVIIDSVGGANGTVIGENASFTGSGQLSLPGGAGGATSGVSYVDLPNGLLSSHPAVTFEAWYTIGGAQNWSRIWDFGSSAGGEVTGVGGGGEGQDYFMFAPNHVTNIDLQRLAGRNLDPLAGGAGGGPVDGVEESHDAGNDQTLNEQNHVAGVWETTPGGGELTLYFNGVNMGGRTTTFGPGDMNDVNNWLGRSNWTGDSYFQGSFDEFRIWDNAFDDAFAAASFAAGPNVVVPEPQIAALLSLSGLALIFRRRRR